MLNKRERLGTSVLLSGSISFILTVTDFNAVNSETYLYRLLYSCSMMGFGCVVFCGFEGPVERIVKPLCVNAYVIAIGMLALSMLPKNDPVVTAVHCISGIVFWYNASIFMFALEGRPTLAVVIAQLIMSSFIILIGLYLIGFGVDTLPIFDKIFNTNLTPGYKSLFLMIEGVSLFWNTLVLAYINYRRKGMEEVHPRIGFFGNHGIFTGVFY